MALIKCSECNKDVSDKATSCPHCGHPINSRKYLSKYSTKQIAIGSIVAVILYFCIYVAFDKFQEAPKGIEMSEQESQHFNWWEYTDGNRCVPISMRTPGLETPYDIQRFFINRGYTCKLIVKDEFKLEGDKSGRSDTYIFAIGATSKYGCENFVRRHHFSIN